MIGILLLFVSTLGTLEATHVHSSIVQSKINPFKVALHHRLEASRLHKKRHVLDATGEMQVRVDSASTDVDMPFLSVYGLTCWAPVGSEQVLVGTQGGHLILFDHRNGHSLSASEEEDVARKIMVFRHLEEQWFAVLHTSSIRLYLLVGRGLERRQTILLDGKADFDMVTLKGVHYMAAVHRSQLVLYHWSETQFDMIAKRAVHSPLSVACWKMDGSIYVAVAAEKGSPIFLYNAKENNEIVLLQELVNYDAKKVLHFFVGGSHYVIFCGQQEASIYWWTSGQFLQWQVIENTTNALDISILTLSDGEILIGIVLRTEVLYLTLDASGQYIISYSMPSDGFSFASLYVLYTGETYYALTLFSDKPHSVWKLSTNFYFIPSASSFDTLSQCIDDVSDILDEKQSELNAIHLDLNRVWLKDRKQTLTAKVTVAGGANSQKTASITEVIVLIDRKLSDSSLPEVEVNRSRLEGMLGAVQDNVRNTMLKSAAQDIRGNVHFVDTLSMPSVSLDSFVVDTSINGVPLSRLSQFALRKSADQKFSHPVRINGLNSREVITGNVNGFQVGDLLLLRDYQQVSGSLLFDSLVTTDITTSSVNLMDTGDWVTRTSNQTIQHQKGMTALNARRTRVTELTNGKDLSDLVQRVVTKDGEEELLGHVTFASPLYVRGDIFITDLVNDGFSISQLAQNSVTKHTNQTLRGLYSFMSPQTVSRDILATAINGVRPSSLLTLSTPQKVSGDLTFTLITIGRDLLVNRLNGIDVSEEAIRKNVQNQFILGFKEFREPVSADFVDMTESVLLDGVDPSLLVQDIVKHEEGVVTHDEVAFHNVIVLGNLSMTEGLNGYSISEWPKMLWLKSIPQEIFTSVKTAKLIAKDITNVQVVNSLKLDSDLVRSYDDEEILSIKTFRDVTNGQTLVANKINGFDVHSVTEEVDVFNNGNAVRGEKTFPNLVIMGDIDTSMLNNLFLAEFMQPYARQYILGNLTLANELVVLREDMKAQTVDFNTFNSKNITTFFENAVRIDEHKHRLALKEFSKLRGINFVSSSLKGLFERVVTLDTAQTIQSDSTLLNSVNIQGPFTVFNLNGRPWDSLARSVVVVDETTLITHPVRFESYFSAGSVTVQEFINELNLNELQMNVFMKSRDNRMEQHVTFLSGLDIGRLLTDRSLDGVEWADVILTNDDETILDARITSDIFMEGDLFITGHLNGCDLTKLGQLALYTSHSNQLVQEEIVIETLQVVGNLQMFNVFNNISIQDLQKKVVSVSGEQVITEPVRMPSGMVASGLRVQVINGLNLEYLKDDVVRRSLPQEITGTKRFQQTTAANLNANELFLHGTLDDVNLNEFYSTIVWKHQNQFVDGDKIFLSMSANVATAESYLNGLLLPQDVVLSYTDDVFSNPVFLKSDVILGSDLIVDGAFAGVVLDDLLKNRVTLSGLEMVMSSLIFSKDALVYGDLIVEDTINNVILDLVVKAQSGHELQGHKIFSGGLNLLGSLNAVAVNGLDLQELSRSIRGPRAYNELQVFERPVRTSYLFSELVNGLPLSPLIDSFGGIQSNQNNALEYLGETISDVGIILTQQLQKVQNKVSKFAYFILLQEVYLGPTTKVLKAIKQDPVSRGFFSVSLAVWVSEERCSEALKCCQLQSTQWCRIDDTGRVQPYNHLEFGTYFPVQDLESDSWDQQLVMWTNATDSRWCSGVWDPRVYFGIYSTKTALEIASPVLGSAVLADIRSFRRGLLYVIAGFHFDRTNGSYSYPVIYALDGQWIEYQILPSFGVLSLDTIDLGDQLLLAMGTVVGTSVYRWDDNKFKFVLEQNIPSQQVTSILWLLHKSHLFLVVTTVDVDDCSKVGGQVDIYSYQQNVMWLQSLPLRDVVAMISFVWEGETYLVAASRQVQSLLIYQWKGYSRFDLVQSLFVGKVTHLESYWLQDDLYLIVALRSGPLKVLKMLKRG